MKPFRKVRLLMEMIRFEHTIFTLPFAFISMLLACWRTHHPLTAHIVFWIVIAMIGARSAAMSFNRLADAGLDASNPRTRSRHIPAGVLTRMQVTLFLLLSILLLFTAAWQLNPLCLELAPLALAAVLGYSYTKRFTSLCHLFLGIATGLAPVGAWVAVTGSISLLPLLLGAVVMLWIGGFDIIYALQDYEHDVSTPGMHSLPKHLGKSNALAVSRSMHFVMLCLLLAAGHLAGLHWIFYLGVAVAGSLIVWEQSLVHPDDIRRVNLAFFTINGWVSVSLFVFVLLDGLLLK